MFGIPPDTNGIRIFPVTMTPDELNRWSRQTRLPQIGPEGQEKLAAAKVAIVGLGGLGCPAATYLAVAGVGTLGLIDDDVVELSNLQRQVLFGESEIGQKKVAVAAEHLSRLNTRLQVSLHPLRLTAANAIPILSGYDLVIDGSDNFPTRYAVNDACVILKKPNVYGSVLQFEGRASLFVPGDGPCYRCFHPEPPPQGTVLNCAEAGVLGVLPGVIGAIQASETVKWICGIGKPLVGRLLVFDMLAMSFTEFQVPRNLECAVCGDHPSIEAPVEYAEACGGESWGEDYDLEDRITPRVAFKRLQSGDPLFVLDVREPSEAAVARLPRATLIPLGELPRRAVTELGHRRSEEVVVLCHHGVRSALAADWLRRHGFKRVKNLEGGIDRWSAEVDPSIPRY